MKLKFIKRMVRSHPPTTCSLSLFLMTKNAGIDRKSHFINWVIIPGHHQRDHGRVDINFFQRKSVPKATHK